VDKLVRVQDALPEDVVVPLSRTLFTAERAELLPDR
jgi:hypothetical protein